MCGDALVLTGAGELGLYQEGNGGCGCGTASKAAETNQSGLLRGHSC